MTEAKCLSFHYFDRASDLQTILPIDGGTS